MIRLQFEKEITEKKLNLLRASQMDGIGRFNGYDLGKNLISGHADKREAIEDYQYQLLCLDKIKSYVDAVGHRFIDIKKIASRSCAKHTAEEINCNEKTNLSALTYLLFFDPKIDEELFAIAPLAFSALIKGYIKNYYESNPAAIREDKKEIIRILVEGYGFNKRDARGLRNRIYEYIPKALMVSGFFARIGEDKKIDEESFAEDYRQSLALQNEIVKKLLKKLEDRLKELGAPMHTEQNSFDRFKRFLRV